MGYRFLSGNYCDGIRSSFEEEVINLRQCNMKMEDSDLLKLVELDDKFYLYLKDRRMIPFAEILEKLWNHLKESEKGGD